jgi:hypothetical protein
LIPVAELLELFRTRAKDPALVGHTSYTRECFELAAKELELAIKASEPANLIAWIPPDVRDLVHEALHFDPDSEEDWQVLGQAAVNIQTGPS